jgi:mannose-6-phosphate isomerase
LHVPFARRQFQFPAGAAAGNTIDAAFAARRTESVAESVLAISQPKADDPHIDAPYLDGAGPGGASGVRIIMGWRAAPGRFAEDLPVPAPPLYPLRFTPSYQYRLWGGRRLEKIFGVTLPGHAPIGEAWLLSDRADHSSLVANGALKGQTLTQVLGQWPDDFLGANLRHASRFPLLLKFLDVQGVLSVQVHPSDEQVAYHPAGETGKTEAWVVLLNGPQGLIYAGLRPQTTSGALERAISDGRVAECLESFTPDAGDGVFVPAGTVHSLRDVVVFEVQENSDVTYRLYDWKQVDPVTHEPRPLQVREAMACIDYSRGAVAPVIPVMEEAGPASRERLFDCKQFTLWRLQSSVAFTVGKMDTPRVLVCIAGAGSLRHHGIDYACSVGEVLLLPAVVGACMCRPVDSIALLEIALPDGDAKS